MGKLIFFLHIILLTASAHSVYAGNFTVLTNKSEKYTITKSFEIFEDKNNSYNLDYIKNNRHVLPFKKNTSDSINLGYTDSTHWLRTKIVNTSVIEDWLIEVAYPCLDHVTFYSPDEKNEYLAKESGDMISFKNREIQYRTFVFKLHVKRNSEKIIYFKIFGEGAMIFPINLYTPYAFSNKVNDEEIMFGFYFGIMLVMMIFNSFIFLSIRDRSYLFYVLYILTTFLGQLALNGYFSQYVFPDNPVIVNKSVPFFISFMLFNSSIFSKSFLNLNSNFKRGNVALTIAAVIMGFVMLISLVGRYNLSIKLCGAIGSFVAVNIIIVSSISLYRGNRVARFFLLAWIFMLLGMILYALRSYGLLPDIFITAYGAQIGSVIEVVLLSIALADRINILKQENLAAREKIITIQKSYTESLEKTVRERTAELEIERNKLKARNESMEHELTLARKIQEQLIPVHQPADFIYSLYKPMDQVGGDFYDFIKFKNSDQIGIFLSDVSGHGVPAAFITLMVKTIIMQAGESKENPAELLHYINRLLYNQTGGNFVTAFYGIYNPLNNSLVYSNAGHNPPTIILDGNINPLLGPKSVPVGIMNNMVLRKNNKTYTNSEIILPDASKLLLFTDGLVEARPVNNADLYFEYSIMNDVLLELKKLPPELFIKELYSKLVAFRGSNSFDDDVCLICLDVP